MKKAKYKVGQVVCLDKMEFYTKTRPTQLYQRIVKIEPWAGGDAQCLYFLNGDACHEKWVRPLRARERGI